MPLGAPDAEKAEAASLPTVALVGNPNTGKTTLFNALTGLKHQVGNYPGVTVEHIAGRMKRRDSEVEIIDLPGTYSLAARSNDELVAADVLLGQQAGVSAVDVIVAILDASNLARNLYLTSQLLELGLPVVVALNMSDVARRRGIAIDTERLSRRLGAPVVTVRADRREGIEELEDAILGACAKRPADTRDTPSMPRELDEQIDALHAWLQEKSSSLGREVSRTEAFRALIDVEGAIPQRFVGLLGDDFRHRLDEARSAVGCEKPLASLEAAARYRWLGEIVRESTKHPDSPVRTFTDRVDAVLTHKVFGTLTLALVLLVMFQSIYAWAGPLMDLISAGTDALAGLATRTIPEGALQSLVVDGVIGGVGGIIIFLPQILLLFLFVALLEDCGYMARAAFLMDRLLTRVGLSGQSVIPLLSSFACAIPGVMAARSISNRRDRFATILVAPLMSCSARLPVYVLLIGAFVPERAWLGGLVGMQGLTLFAAHLVGIAVAIPVVWIVKRTLLSGPVPAFVMELPEYKVPTPRIVMMRLYNQGKEFIVRAGTVILAFSILVWVLSYFPRPVEIAEQYDERRALATSEEAVAQLDREEASAYLRQSIMGRLGHAVEPAVRPLGWDWRIGMAAVASFPAREVVIASLGTILGVGDEVDEESGALLEKMKRATWPDGRPLFNLPVALSLIVFFALCCQCASTLAVIRRETGSWGWVWITFGYMTALAYLGALVAYQVSWSVLS